MVVNRPLINSQDPLSRYLQAEVATMRQTWTSLTQASPSCPTWTWDDVKEALLAFTTCPTEELVIRGALTALLKQARFKPADLLLEEVLRLAIAAHDLGFRQSARQMLEDEMP